MTRLTSRTASQPVPTELLIDFTSEATFSAIYIGINRCFSNISTGLEHVECASDAYGIHGRQHTPQKFEYLSV